jgi:F0F1-type ATP synthase assembly protein I
MNNKKKTLNDFNQTLKEIGPYLGIGVQLAATIIIMLLIGQWLDEKFEKKYVFTIIFAFLGVVSGMYNLLRTLNYLEKKKMNNNEL